MADTTRTAINPTEAATSEVTAALSSKQAAVQQVMQELEAYREEYGITPQQSAPMLQQTAAIPHKTMPALAEASNTIRQRSTGDIESAAVTINQSTAKMSQSMDTTLAKEYTGNSNDVNADETTKIQRCDLKRA